MHCAYSQGGKLFALVDELGDDSDGIIVSSIVYFYTVPAALSIIDGVLEVILQRYAVEPLCAHVYQAILHDLTQAVENGSLLPLTFLIRSEQVTWKFIGRICS